MAEETPGRVDRFVAKGSRVVLGLLGAVVASCGAWIAVAILAKGQTLPPLYGPIWLVGLGALAISFALREPKRVHAISIKARLLSAAYLALACVSGLFGFSLAVAVGVSAEFDTVVPWVLLGVAVLLMFVGSIWMLKLGARYRSTAEIEETRKKLFYEGAQ